MRDLRPGRRHEVVEEPGGDVLLGRRQLGHGSLEVLLHDVLGAAEPIERLDPHSARPAGALLVPQALHHELEVRRLDAGAVCGALDRAEPAERRLDLACTDVVQHALDEIGVDRHVLVGELGEALDRTDDRCASGLTVEPIEPERVPEETGDATGEAVELRQRVLAERHQHVDPVRRREQRRQRLGERSRAGIVGVVEEVLLDLVEDEVDVALRLGALERSHGRSVRGATLGLGDGLGERGGRVFVPA